MIRNQNPLRKRKPHLLSPPTPPRRTESLVTEEITPPKEAVNNPELPIAEPPEVFDDYEEVNGKKLLGLYHSDVVSILKELPMHVRIVCARPGNQRKKLISQCLALEVLYKHYIQQVNNW